MEIYINPVKKILVEERDKIYLRDITEIIAPNDVQTVLGKEKILQISSQLKKSYLVAVTDIVRVIKKKFPNYSIINLGEKNTVIEYMPHALKENRFLKALRIFFVCIVLFMGAATAIMSFHSDAQIPQVFTAYHKMFFGYELQNPKIIAVPYSIGLASGIIIFFNHFGGKKITNDPTPIEVEMSLYDTDIYNTLVDNIKTDEKEKQDSKNKKV